MSQKPGLPSRLPSRTHLPARRKPISRLASLGSTSRKSAAQNDPATTRRASVAGLTAGQKTQRTSKTTHKLVVLPSAPQTRPLLAEIGDDLTLPHELDGGVQEYKSQAERMTKDQRKQAGFKRLTAYCVAESLKMKLLSSFLKREHNVTPRVFDESVYVMYHLPLLPGYGPNTNVRSSAHIRPKTGKSVLAQLSEAEENGYQGTYFTTPRSRSPETVRGGYISSGSPVQTRNDGGTHHEPEMLVGVEAHYETDAETDRGFLTEPETPASEIIPPMSISVDFDPGAETDPGTYGRPSNVETRREEAQEIGEVIFFEYGVIVFFGLGEGEEQAILEDLDNAGVLRRKLPEDDWEVEECHFAHDPLIRYPRVYNDFFTLKSTSHLLKLSIAHALAQSTLLARYESNAQRVLSSPLTMSIPKQLAESGALRLRRHEALKLTGRLFKLRRDVNLVSNVLDVPELFWSEASLKNLYDAVREYMEIQPRVQVLNEKLGVVGDFLDAIHDHLNNSAMERITWIIIWLIVVACVVEFGEILARLIFHATKVEETKRLIANIAKEDTLRTLERMMHIQS